MSKIIKFPSQCSCEGCGKPLSTGEGTPCPVEGCVERACDFCADQSVFCKTHMDQDPDYGKSLR